MDEVICPENVHGRHIVNGSKLLGQARVPVKKFWMTANVIMSTLSRHKVLSKPVQEAHGTTPGEPVLHCCQLLGISRSAWIDIDCTSIVQKIISDIFLELLECASSPGGNGKILDKDLKELRAPSGREVGVAQPVVKADILLDLGWEEMSNRKDFLDTSQCCKLVQKEPEEIIRLYKL